MKPYQVLEIPLHLIDEPKLAMRSDVDGDDIQQLVSDIKAVGLMQPINVRPVGDRYEVIAGHRRTRAHKILGWPTIKAIITDAGDDEAFTMRTIENLSRHDVNPVDEATYIGTMMTEHNKTIEQIAELVHRSRDWVTQRLDVFNMPDYLQDHIRTKRVSLGVALELNKIENDEQKRSLVSFAAVNGCTIPQAKRWVLDVQSQISSAPRPAEHIAGAVGEMPVHIMLVRCARCGEQIPLEEAVSVWVHRGTECPPASAEGLG
jgi:ParB family chromosome partitioning protein